VNAVADLAWDTAEPELTVADVMSRGFVHCPRNASLRAIAALMTDARVHCVVVIDDASNRRSLWGVVSDLDLIAAATVRSLDEQEAGGSAMKPAVTIGPHEPLATAAGLMTKHGVSHLVVVDPVNERPLGIISTLDVAGALAAAWSPRRCAPDAYFPAPDPRRGADSGGSEAAY
jgi:CBS domain-containing protein